MEPPTKRSKLDYEYCGEAERIENLLPAEIWNG